MKIFLFLLIVLSVGPGFASSIDAGCGAMKRVMNLTVNGYTLVASMEDNSSVDALFEMLEKGPIVLEMKDYANMEKVGDLGAVLPKNDRMLDADAGDVILYQGRNLVIYYDKNSWNLTLMGRIDGVSKNELKYISGAVEVILSIGR